MIYHIRQVIRMKLERKIKPRDARGNPARAIFIAVFAMFILSGLMLLILALLLYKLELSESVVRVGIVVIYVVSGLLGGFRMGRIMRERKYLWGLSAGVLYFVVLFLASGLVKGGFDIEPVKMATTLILCGASGMAGGMVS